MKAALIPFAAALFCTFAGNAGAALSREEYKAQKQTIEADYKAAKSKCSVMKGNARDICSVQAKGNHNVARAELEAQQEPSPRHDQKV